MSTKLILSVLIINFFWLTSCSQNTNPTNYVENTTIEEQPIKTKYKAAHAFGGWYCPDNLKGFPAVDIQKLDKIPVVNGRLPTKEETQNGTSLMYFDTTTMSNVRPLKMTMPKLARYYSEYTKKNELIVVIQAVVIENDTIVGFRYVNGGNGSAWFGEVDFMMNNQIDELKSTSFVSYNAKINASKENVWKVITSPTYAESLGEMFDKNAFKVIKGKRNPTVFYKYAPDNNTTSGRITNVWENVYIQIDYNFEGIHYVQKFLVSENKETNTTYLNIVSGPYINNFESQSIVWNDWLQKVKVLSEGIIDYKIEIGH